MSWVHGGFLISDSFCAGVYDADGGLGENTFGWKSLGQELRINDVTVDLPSFQHGNRALVAKDMRKSQGRWNRPRGVLSLP